MVMASNSGDFGNDHPSNLSHKDERKFGTKNIDFCSFDAKILQEILP